MYPTSHPPTLNSHHSSKKTPKNVTNYNPPIPTHTRYIPTHLHPFTHIIRVYTTLPRSLCSSARTSKSSFLNPPIPVLQPALPLLPPKSTIFRSCAIRIFINVVVRDSRCESIWWVVSELGRGCTGCECKLEYERECGFGCGCGEWGWEGRGVSVVVDRLDVYNRCVCDGYI